MKKFSIITISYNCKDDLQKTIESVLSQDLSLFEYIVIDGGSNDGSVELLQSYDNQIDCWVSEPDKGIYDAMNKGIDKSNGEFLIFLNAGDYFVGKVLGYEILGSGFLPVKYHDIFNNLKHVQIRNYKRGLPYCHQGIVFENKNIKYNQKYTISSDYDFYLANGLKNIREIYNTTGYVYYDNKGLSFQQSDIRDKESYEIILDRFGKIDALIFMAKQKFKQLLKKIIKYVNN